MRTVKTLAAAAALLASSCTGTPLPPDGSAALRPKASQFPARAAAAPRSVSREVVFAPSTPPALLPPSSRPEDGTVIHLGRRAKSVGADPSEPGDYDDGSFLPPVPPPPGVEASTEEIPSDFLEGGPAGDPGEPVFAEEEWVEGSEWVDGEESCEEPWEEDSVVEVVEVSYYEVVEVPTYTTVTFGTPVLVMDGYRCWGWGRFPAVRNAHRYDPCSTPRHGAWWDSRYDPHWNPCYDPSYGSWERWDEACRSNGNVYLDRDGDRFRTRFGPDHDDGHDRHDGATTVKIGGNRPPAIPPAGGSAGPKPFEGGGFTRVSAPPLPREEPVASVPAPAPAPRPAPLTRRPGVGAGPGAGNVAVPRLRPALPAAVVREEPADPPARSLPAARLLPQRTVREAVAAGSSEPAPRAEPSRRETVRERPRETVREPARERVDAPDPEPRTRAGTFGAPAARPEPRTREPAPSRAEPEPRRESPRETPREARSESPRESRRETPRAEPPAREPARSEPAPQPRSGGGGGGGGSRGNRGGDGTEVPQPKGRNR